MRIFIYALSDPQTCEVRYVGKSINPKGRLRAHLSTSRTGRYKHYTANWIASLLRIGLVPLLSIIKEVPEGKSWQDAEKRAIANALANGARLTNLTRGGDGCEGASPEVQAAKSEAMKEWWQRDDYRARIIEHRNSPEFTQEQGDRLRGRWRDRVAREKMNGSRWTPEKRREQAERIAARNRKPLDPEMVKRRNASIKASWARRKGI